MRLWFQMNAKHEKIAIDGQASYTRVVMSSAYIFQNQHQHFLSKSGEWVDGREGQALLKTFYKDEALNTKVEQTVKNPDLRIRIVECELNSRGLPQLNLPKEEQIGSNPLLEELE